MKKETKQRTEAPAVTKLAYTARELSRSLGISTKSLRRLEQRGLLRPSRALRKKLYSAATVKAFLEESV